LFHISPVRNPPALGDVKSPRAPTPSSRPEHGEQRAKPFFRTREPRMTSDSPRATYETEISARFYLASYGPRSLKSLRRFREEVPQLSRPESRWCDVRSTRHRRYVKTHALGVHARRCSRSSVFTARRCSRRLDHGAISIELPPRFRILELTRFGRDPSDDASRALRC